MGTSDSMDSPETQSGQTATPVGEEIALLKLLGGESDNVISETNGRVSTTELTQATEACNADQRRLRPPHEHEREALSQLLSEKGLLTMLERPELSSEVAASLVNSRGQVLKANSNLGNKRQWQRRVVSICESWRSGSLLRASFTFLTLLMSTEWQKERGPIGHSRRTLLSSYSAVINMTAFLQTFCENFLSVI